MRYIVTQRTHEIGIRRALGSQKRDVLRMILGEGLKQALGGVAIGIVVARLLSSLLYGVKPNDPFTFAAVALILMSVVLVACYIPARRAANVDPMLFLRYERFGLWRNMTRPKSRLHRRPRQSALEEFFNINEGLAKRTANLLIRPERRSESKRRSFFTEHRGRIYSRRPVGGPATSNKADHQNDTGHRAKCHRVVRLDLKEQTTNVTRK